MPHSVAVVTSSRADYSLLYPVIRLLLDDPFFDCRVVVTGSHLMESQGYTATAIEGDGVPIAARIPIFVDGGSGASSCQTLAIAIAKFDEYFQSSSPELLVVLGDRFEMFGVVSAACLHGIPIAHIHGGEITQGAVDDFMRHAITKLSHLHFTCCEEYRKRVIQLGEDPRRVFNVGALGVENALNTKLLPLGELEEDLGLSFAQTTALVTFHPETVGGRDPAADARALVDALASFEHMNVIFTKSNADDGGEAINEVLDHAVVHQPNWKLFASLGMVRYLTAMGNVDLLVGNTSSGILEAPSFGVPVVNIGSRQDGRIRATNIIDCPIDSAAIRQSIDMVLTPDFRARAKQTKSPFGDGRTSGQIVQIIKSRISEGLEFKKSFYDLPPCENGEKNG